MPRAQGRARVPSSNASAGRADIPRLSLEPRLYTVGVAPERNANHGPSKTLGSQFEKPAGQCNAHRWAGSERPVAPQPVAGASTPGGSLLPLGPKERCWLGDAFNEG